MFCITCGNKLNDGEKFCTECGNLTTSEKSVTKAHNDERWWHRLANVFYVFAHLPLLIIVPLVWTENARQYSTYYKTYRGSDGEAIWYCFLTIVIWLLVLRLAKMALRYIVHGSKPKFKELLFF